MLTTTFFIDTKDARVCHSCGAVNQRNFKASENMEQEGRRLYSLRA